MRRFPLRLLFLGTLIYLGFWNMPVKASGVGEILEEYAQDYRQDPTARSITIGFKVGNEEWLLDVARREPPPHDVKLTKGFPDYPIMYWQLSEATLRRIASGMTGETATQRSRADDPRLMVLHGTENFPRFMWSPDFQTLLASFKLHFFAKGVPEIIALDADHGVSSHGQTTVGLYYAPKLSTFWTSMAPGQKVNFEENLETNDQLSILVIMKGKGMAEIDGNVVALQEGHAVVIPAGITHRFWNPFDTPMEAFQLLYGDGLNE